MTKISALVLAALALSLAFTATAAAQSTLDGYSDTGGTVQNKVDDSPAGDTAGTQDSGDEDEEPSGDVAGDVEESDDDSLPFTGLDVALLAAAGCLLLALGFGLRRLTRPTT